VSAAAAREPGAPWRAMIGAELLKLRRRRGLFWSTLLLVVGPVVVAYVVLALRHAIVPEHAGPAGGVENLRGTLEALAGLGSVGAIMVGVTAGGGDFGAGVFRELVVTGRSRLALFAARIPGGLLFLGAFALVAIVLAAVASVALAGSRATPGAGLLLEYAAWVVLALVTAFALALGVGSLLSSRVAIGLLLAWTFVLEPILFQFRRIDFLLAASALNRLEPRSTDARVSLATAVVLVVAWTVIPLAAGAWRTATRDA
jgi:hypothetical protein